MARRYRKIVLAGAFAILGCSPSIDAAAIQAELLARDSAWAAAAASGDVNQVITFWADDAINYFPGAPPAVGIEAIGNLVRANRSRPGFSLSWTPETAVVSSAGDVGYTTGPFTLTAQDPSGATVTRTGHYVCIWRKQSDGIWKCAVESTIFGPME